MLVSKDNLKIRFQANNASALQLVLQQTYSRLLERNPAIKITSNEKMPTLGLLQAIDQHFAYRSEIKKLRKVLDDRTYQLRVIQKKLLNRFKDKNPSALNHLDFLLKHTYSQVIEVGNQIEGLKNHLEETSLHLGNAVASNNLIMKTVAGLSEE